MTTLETIKTDLAKEKPNFFKSHKAKEIGLFGSYARNEQHDDSDVDILIDFDEYPSLLEFMMMEDELSLLVGHPVDLVMKRSLKPHMGRQILKEVVYL